MSSLHLRAVTPPSKRLKDLEAKVFKDVFTVPDAVYPIAWQLLDEAAAEGSLVMQSRAHYYLSSIWNWRNGRDSSHYHARMSLETAIQSQDAAEITAGYNMMGNSYEMMGQLDSAFQAFHSSFEWGEKAQDHRGIARALLNMGMIHRTRGEYLPSLERLHQAKARCIEWNFDNYLANLHRTIGEVYLLIGEMDLAWENLHEGLRRSRIGQRTRIQVASMLALGNHAQLTGDTTEAICWFETSRRIAHAEHIRSMEGEASAKVAAMYLARGELGPAREAAENALEISRMDRDTVTLSSAYYALGLVELQSKQYAAAYQHCRKAHQFARQSDQTNARIHICDCLWRSAGNGGQALVHYQEYIHLRDSLLNRENSMAIARLEARLDYQRRHAADSLLEAAAALQREAVHRSELAVADERTRWSLWLSGFAALLAIAGGVTVFVFRRQNRKLSTQNDLIQTQNSAIHTALQEKEVLLREIHHRVKNNLQVMISLLEIQSDRIGDAAALEALLASKTRVQAMTLIHQKLYQQENIAELEFETYLRQLVEAIRDLYPQGHRIQLVYQLEASQFGLDTAMPLGLILNELVTNAFKYAFAGRGSGTLRLTLRGLGSVNPSGLASPQQRDAASNPSGLPSPNPSGMGGDQHVLIVEDDGPGMPSGFDAQRVVSLGMQLVAGLSRQLKGTLQVGRSDLGGACFSIQFTDQRL